MRDNIYPNQITFLNPLEDGSSIERERERERERESKRRSRHIVYNDIISVENLLAAWREFLRGKRKRKDVIEFSLHLTDNIFSLHQELAEKTYRHGVYHAFKISDPKPREIHKAGVRDRLLHHAIYRILHPYYDRKFIFDSYSCRLGKGTHRAINRFREYGRIVSQNHTRTAWVLKCDIKKFFASIDHEILIIILKKYIVDKNIIWLLENIIESYETSPIGFATSPLERGKTGRGLPLGNLTSQLFANIYMNEFDQWVNFPRLRVLRTSTKRRMFKRLETNNTAGTKASYLGLLNHGDAYKLKRKIISAD